MKLKHWSKNLDYFDDLKGAEYEAFKTDIKTNGITNPLHILADGTVICGNQRLRAARDLGINDEAIPTKSLASIWKLPEDERAIIIHAIKDNILRRQLTPEQKAKPVGVMLKLLNDLTTDRWGKTDPATKGLKSRDIVARELGLGSGGAVQRLIEYNAALEELPELKGEKLTVAIKKWRKHKAIKLRKANLTDVKIENLHHGDALIEIKKIPDGSVDCVITDPPYGIDFKSSHGGGTNDFKDDTEEYALNLLRKITPDLFRVLKDNSHLYVFTSWRNLGAFKDILSTQFKVNSAIVWVKNNFTTSNFQLNYAPKYEMVLFCTKGTRHLIQNMTPDVLEVQNKVNKSHSSEKPEELLKIFIKNSTVEGECVLDPFAGSGTTLVASKELKRNYIGIEIEEYFYNMTRERLNGIQIKGN